MVKRPDNQDFVTFQTMLQKEITSNSTDSVYADLLPDPQNSTVRALLPVKGQGYLRNYLIRRFGMETEEKYATDMSYNNKWNESEKVACSI